MRALLHVDVVTLARVLLSVDCFERIKLCDHIFDRAQAADKYRKRFGKYHICYGTGSVASACQALAKAPEPFLSNREYAHCLKIIFQRVLIGPNPARR